LLRLLYEPVVLGGRLPHGALDLLGLPGFAQEAEDSPLVDRGDHRLHVRVAREEDANGVWIPRADVGQELHAADFRHALVRHDDVDLVLLHEAVPLVRAAGLQDLELEAQQIVDRVADVRLVVHHEEAVSRQPSHDAPPELSGRKTRKQLPLPGSLETSSRPPCPVTMPWVIDRPRPVPSPTALVVKKGSKTWGRSCGGIPQPLSATSRVRPRSRSRLRRTYGRSISSASLRTRAAVAGSAAARRSQAPSYASRTAMTPCVSRSSTARLFATYASGLLISCATPAVSR